MEMSKSEIIDALQKRFPSLEIKCGSEFSKDMNPECSLWLRNASNVSYTDKDSNPLSALDNKIYSDKNYELDVYKKFDAWCVKRGWYPTTEDYTLILFKIK